MRMRSVMDSVKQTSRRCFAAECPMTISRDSSTECSTSGKIRARIAEYRDRFGKAYAVLPGIGSGFACIPFEHQRHRVSLQNSETMACWACPTTVGQRSSFGVRPNAKGMRKKPPPGRHLRSTPLCSTTLFSSLSPFVYKLLPPASQTAPL